MLMTNVHVGFAVPLPIFHVDAFTGRPFAGNPAKVCILPSWREDHWLQLVAAEMNLAETAFLVTRSDHIDLRWFTPKFEEALCGHATLASAHILWQEGFAEITEPIVFSTKSGTLKASHLGEEIELDFPLEPESPAALPAEVIDALGVSPRYVGKNRCAFLVEVESEIVLRELTPDFRLLASWPRVSIIVTSRSTDPKFDFVSRFFDPAAGIDEDPVTGTAHCCLGDFWRKRLGKSEFQAYQASARGGVVGVRVTEDRAYLRGKAVTVAKGELYDHDHHWD
jgi:PhzF family phenazine biosynthesis protein